MRPKRLTLASLWTFMLRSILLVSLVVLAPFASISFSEESDVLQDVPTKSFTSSSEEILLIGNSYTSANSLTNLLDDVMHQSSTSANVSSLTGGGMKLSDHASDAQIANHQWNTTINAGNWNWVVLQDQSQVPGFPRTNQQWIDSKDGAVTLNEMIEDTGSETMLFMTWGRRAGDSTISWLYPDFSTMQDELEQGYIDYRDNLSSVDRPVWIAPVGLAFKHIHDEIVSSGGTPTNSGTLFYDLYSSDGSHPSLSGSYLAACVIYASITGDNPVGLSHTTSLSNSRVLELQQAAAATVFNETNHLSYPWQISSTESNIIPNSIGYFPATNYRFFSEDKVVGSDGSSIILIDWVNSTIIDSATCTGFQEFENDYVFRNNDTMILCSDSIYSVNSSGFTLLRTGNFDSTYVPELYQYLDFHKVGYYVYPKIMQNGTVIDSWQDTLGNGAATTGYDSGWVGYWNPDSSMFGYLMNTSIGTRYTSATIMSERSFSTTSYVRNIALDLSCVYDGAGYFYYSSSAIAIESGIIASVERDADNSNLGLGGLCVSIRIPESPTSSDFYITRMFTPGSELFDASFNRGECDIMALDSGTYLNGTLIRGGSTSVDCIDTSHYLFADGGELFIASSDSDGDQVIDYLDKFVDDITQWDDTDGDGYGDNSQGNLPDICPDVVGNSTEDVYGCRDSDGDGWSDTRDMFPNDIFQWNNTDGDLYGDNYPSSAGEYTVGSYWDDCPNEYGTSHFDYYGCWDSDGDGWSDLTDVFPLVSTQWNDTDGDGYGDYLLGFQADSCISEFGTSTIDKFGCIDSDGDGWSDAGDDLPYEPTQWKDRDGDGYGDNDSGNNPDLFKSDGSQWNDTDGDGYGDERTGNLADAFPDDATEWKDSDADGLGDNADDFPFDPTQKVDSDGDGMGDNPMGIGADKFPNDSTQWGDIDGDGYGDNSTGINADAFITDPTQWSDRDGDGYGDNPAGRMYDMFPDNPTQWEDLDGDGLGDNQNGTNADPYLNDFDNDGYNDSIDILPKLASPGDMDNDGCLDEEDAFPDDFRECKDSDGDGEGDNADTDDDNDGWADTDEMRLGTNSFSSEDKPVDSFEIVLPGTAIGLGAWDLIGIFGGVPFFTWLVFCLVTRGARSKRLEQGLFEARSELELSEISDRYEWALLWKLIGPHQALRLERIRSNLEFNMNQMEEEMNKDGYQPVSDIVTSPSINAQGTVNTDGYEWIKHEGVNWYRLPNTNAEWIKWQ